MTPTGLQVPQKTPEIHAISSASGALSGAPTALSTGPTPPADAPTASRGSAAQPQGDGPTLPQDGQDASTPPNDSPDSADALRGILMALPPNERPAVVRHIQALAAMTPAKRAALLTLTT